MFWLMCSSKHKVAIELRHPYLRKKNLVRTSALINSFELLIYYDPPNRACIERVYHFKFKKDELFWQVWTPDGTSDFETSVRVYNNLLARCSLKANKSIINSKYKRNKCSSTSSIPCWVQGGQCQSSPPIMAGGNESILFSFTILFFLH